MSEEAENNGGGFFSNLKNQIITGAGVVDILGLLCVYKPNHAAPAPTTTDTRPA